jgi:DNA polymerase-3 subunit epsilon/ATP-dependent DNA helicase DinG
MAHYNEICISLDIETTGLSKERDQIIEIGVIKFKGEEIIDSLETLINPGIKVPYEVLSITGIKLFELENAPKFKEIKSALKDFIGTCPIVGHNIDFDLGFLENNGLKLKNLRYDTWHLALILLPGLSTYALESLARVLDIEPLDTHRALADAQTAKDVFLYLVNLINKINQPLRKEINFYIKKSHWDLTRLFEKTEIRTDFIKAKLPKALETSKTVKGLEGFKSVYEITKKPSLVRNLKVGESEEFLIKVLSDALESKSFSFIESTARPAGFLIPAIYYSSANHKKIIISYIYDKKEQIIRSISSIKKFLPFDFSFFEFKDSYFCLRKFNDFKKNNKFSTIELKFLIKTMLWLNSDPDINSSSSFNYEEKKLWERVSFASDDCLSRQCPFYSDCFFYRAYKNAQKSQIILVEHINFFKDVVAKSSEKFLPAFRNFIITEAHSIEDDLTRATTFSFSRMGQEVLLENIGDSLANLNLLLSDQNEIVENLVDINDEIFDLKKKFDIFWGLWGMFWQEKSTNRGTAYFQLNQDIRYGPSWQKIKEGATALILRMGLLVGKIEGLIQKLQANDSTEKEFSSLELYNYKKQVDKNILLLEDIILKKYLDKNFIYWVAFKNEGEHIEINKTPLSIQKLISKNLLVLKDNAIFISGAVNQSKFDYIRERLGLSNFKMVELFQQKKVNLPSVYIIEDLVEPEKLGYKKTLQNWTLEFIKKSNNNVFFLFSSDELMKDVFKAILPLSDKLKINVLSQDRASIKRIMEKLANKGITDSRYVILGKDNLLKNLTSLDLSINDLVITRLPFESLAYPIRASRAEKMAHGFTGYSLPRSIIRLRENLDDFAKIASKDVNIYLLDKRIISKDYGLDFLKNLSDFNLIYQKKTNVDK